MQFQFILALKMPKYSNFLSTYHLISTFLSYMQVNINFSLTCLYFRKLDRNFHTFTSILNSLTYSTFSQPFNQFPHFSQCTETRMSLPHCLLPDYYLHRLPKKSNESSAMIIPVV